MQVYDEDENENGAVEGLVDLGAANPEKLDEPATVNYYLGEVGEVVGAENKLPISFFSDGVSTDYLWDDQESMKILKVNDVNAGDLFKTCGAEHVANPH
ncbi:unnamed protein product [Bathycoccus prasinos]